MRTKPCIKALIIVSIFASLGCGVKGDPLPPEKPPELGRGRPTYKRATKELKYPNLPPAEEESLEEDLEEEESENGF